MAEEPNFTIRLGKIKNNRLLDRVQMVCDVFYEPRTKCFAMVYDSEDSMKKYVSAKRLARIEREKDPKKKGEKKKEGRKVTKVKKHQRQKKRGTARRQEINLARKQKKKK